MTQNSALKLTRSIAALLVVLVGQRSYELMTLRRVDTELESLSRKMTNNEDTANFTAAIDQFEETSSAHQTKNQALKLAAIKRIATDRFLDDSTFFSWSSGSEKGSISIKKIRQTSTPIGIKNPPTIGLHLDSTAELPTFLKDLKVNGMPLGAKGATERSPTGSIEEFTKSKVIPISITNSDGYAAELPIKFQVDNDAPQFKLYIKNRGVIEPDEDNRVGLKPDETLSVMVQDATIVKNARFAFHQEYEIKDERNPSHNVTIGQAITTTEFRGQATDWAGNAASIAFKVGPWRKPLPEIETLTVAGQDATQGRSAQCKEDQVEIALRFKGGDVDRTLFVRTKGAEYPLLRSGSSFIAKNVNILGGDTWSGEVVLKQIDRDFSLTKIQVRLDKSAPIVRLYDQKDNVIIPETIEARSGTTWTLAIEDNLELATVEVISDHPTELKVTRQEVRKSFQSFGISVEGSGTIKIKTRDLAGNTTTKKIVFSLTAKMGPRDGAGPKITLWQGETPILREEQVFFWREAKGIQLKIEDPSGIDLNTLRCERSAADVSKAKQAPTSMVLPITIDSNPRIEIADVYGEATDRQFLIQVVKSAAEIGLLKDTKTVTELPIEFQWKIQEGGLDSRLSVELEDPEGLTTTVKKVGSDIKNRGIIHKLPTARNGVWKLRLKFRAFDGTKVIATEEFRVNLKT